MNCRLAAVRARSFVTEKSELRQPRADQQASTAVDMTEFGIAMTAAQSVVTNGATSVATTEREGLQGCPLPPVIGDGGG